MEIRGESLKEIMRRLLLLTFLLGALWLYFTTHFEPYLKVQLVDFEADQRTMRQWTEEQKTLAQLPLEEYVAETTKGRVTVVEGPQWEDFFQKVQHSFLARRAVEGWEHRVNDPFSNDTTLYWLFFHSDEVPWTYLEDSLPFEDRSYLKLGQSADYLMVYQSKPYEIRGIGDTVSEIPTGFAYPYRTYSPWLILIGLFSYIVLPWPRSRPTKVTLFRSRQILLDLFSVIFFLFFFSLPLFIIGGAVEAATRYFFFSLLFWSLAVLAGIMVFYAVYYGVFRVIVHRESLQIMTLTGKHTISYDDIDYIQQARLIPPKWLLWGTKASALFGSNPAQSARIVGSALLLESSKNGGLHIRTKEGSSYYIWYTDQVGNVIFKNFDILLHQLEGRSIEVVTEAVTLSAFFPPLRK
ncbi:hypothetical protein F9B85_00715 [Heliorestis acidaminivorans]|uniref:Uncharacterized protein n=1 Tax=Heliorestis acidaminivorans TaxID=553427 RepID=A0A6I0F3D6_9FIRM|nr:hypothetical protein [Heliorestis acidaminivorans]KAB2954250.1 hypothetical protein F9B85_00715 [Heliorestis acidaminivorans]